MILNMSGGDGSGGKLVVTAPAGATVTVSKEGKEKTTTAGPDGMAVFRGLDNGKWVITISNGSQRYTRKIDIKAYYEEIIEFFSGYLYNAGNEYVGITGGWYSDDEELIKEDDHLLLNGGARQSYRYANTRIPFDTTGYSKITFHYMVSGSHATVEFGLMAADGGIGTYVTADFTYAKDETDFYDVELDISESQGEYFPYFSIHNNATNNVDYGCKLYVSSIKVE